MLRAILPQKRALKKKRDTFIVPSLKDERGNDEKKSPVDALVSQDATKYNTRINAMIELESLNRNYL